MTSPDDIYGETLRVFDARTDPFEPLTTSEVSDALECGRRTVYKRLNELVERNELKTKKTGAKSRVWWRSAASITDAAEMSSSTDRGIQRRLELFDYVQELEDIGGWAYDLEADEGWWTKKVRQIYGLPPGSVASIEESLEFYHPADRPTVENAVERAIDTGKPYDLEVRLIDDSGQLRWVRTHGQPQYEDGEIRRIYGTFQDITERKKRERELERLQTLLADVERLGDIGIWEFDSDTQEGFWSEGTKRIHEVGDEFEPTFERGLEFIHPADQKEVTELVQECLETGDSYSGEFRLITANDNERRVRIEWKAVEQNGSPQTVRGYIQDITERKRQQEEFERLFEQYEAIFENTTDQLALIDVEWTDGDPVFRYLRTNPVNIAETGLEPEMIEGKTPLEVAGPETGNELRENYLQCIEAGETIEYEEKHELENPVYSRTKLTPIIEDGTCTRIVASARDITEQKKREQGLQRYKSLTEAASDVIVSLRHDGTIQEANPVVSGLFGYEPHELRDEPIGKLLSDDSEAELQSSLDGRRSDTNYAELTGVCADGREIPIEVSFSEYEHNDQQYFTAIIRDISTRKERDQFKELDQLNTVIRNISKTIVQANTHEEIANEVCDSLLEFDSFESAVIGEFSPSFEEFDVWAWNGGDDVYNIVTSDSAHPLTQSLGATAVRTGDVQAHQTLDENSSDPWEVTASTDEVQSLAAVPLIYQDTISGVLGIFADQADAFEEAMQTGLTELGEIVGHALNVLERRETLDRAVEIELRSDQFAQPFPEHSNEPAVFEFESSTPLPGESRLEYWTIHEMDAKTYQSCIEARPAIVETRLLSSVGDSARFELVTKDESVASITESFDGDLKSIELQNETAKFLLEFPAHSDTEPAMQQFRQIYPDITLTGRRRILTPTYLLDIIDNQLTERQLTVLQTAYFSGYFEQPRLSKGKTLAENIGITNQTFHQHLRKAEKRVFREIFETDDVPSTEHIIEQN